MNVTRRSKALSSTLVTGLTLAMLSGCATTQSYYVGAGFLANCSNFKNPIQYSGPEDHDNIGFTIFGRMDPGMRERVVFEAGYTRVGDTEFDGLFEGVEDQGTIETETIEVNVGYRYPFTDRFSAGGHIGATYVDVNEAESFGGESYSASASETIVYGGVVARYALNESWGVRAFYDLYPDVGKPGETAEGHLHAFGVSFDYRFGGGNSDE